MDSSLQQFLRDTIPDWDCDGTSANVRANLWRIVNCGTAALGAEVVASTTNQKIVFHTCKSRFCPSCGLQAPACGKRSWSLPFRRCHVRRLTSQCRRFLASFRPESRAVERPASSRSEGNRVLGECEAWCSRYSQGGSANVWRVSHSYPHLHTLVSAGGLDETRVRWIHNLELKKKEHRHELMLAWRFALLA
jgi:Transposase zinc-binding domain